MRSRSLNTNCLIILYIIRCKGTLAANRDLLTWSKNCNPIVCTPYKYAIHCTRAFPCNGAAMWQKLINSPLFDQDTVNGNTDDQRSGQRAMEHIFITSSILHSAVFFEDHQFYLFLALIQLASKQRGGEGSIMKGHRWTQWFLLLLSALLFCFSFVHWHWKQFEWKIHDNNC